MELSVGIYTSRQNYKSCRTIQLTTPEVLEMIASYLETNHLNEDEKLLDDITIEQIRP